MKGCALDCLMDKDVNDPFALPSGGHDGLESPRRLCQACDLGNLFWGSRDFTVRMQRAGIKSSKTHA